MKLVMCKGLPASGKSFWAREYQVVHPGTVVVTKDDIRRELEKTGWKWSRDNERKVEAVRDEQIRNGLMSGHDVISADTNYAPAHERTLRGLAAAHGAEFSVNEFTTPLNICLDRNRERSGVDRVPDDAITSMAKKYLKGANRFDYSGLTRVYQDILPLDTPQCVICDLDGTLALTGGRRNVYDASTCDLDDVNPAVFNLLALYKESGTQIIYMSGREEKYREPTLRFLDRNGCPDGPLLMRPTGDTRTDWIVKSELFDANIRGNWYVDIILDDRDQVVQMWRARGLTCLQVANGDF